MMPASKIKKSVSGSTEPPSGSKSSRSGTRQRSLPPLNQEAPVVHDEEMFALLTQVEQAPGFEYPPSWSTVVYEAKRRGYVTERGIKLYLSNHGAQLLSLRAKGSERQHYTMTKIDRPTRLALKDLSHDTGVTMQDALRDIIRAVHERRDDLTRAARKAGFEHPWEGIAALLGSKTR